jgi:hypothetical protein
MSIENPTNQFSQNQKEQALQKAKVFKMREQLQLALMTERGFDIKNPAKEVELEAMHHWQDDHSAEDFKQAFERVLAGQPNLMSVYEENPEEALKIVRGEFEHIHQTA